MEISDNKKSKGIEKAMIQVKISSVSNSSKIMDLINPNFDLPITEMSGTINHLKSLYVQSQIAIKYINSQF